MRSLHCRRTAHPHHLLLVGLSAARSRPAAAAAPRPSCAASSIHRIVPDHSEMMGRARAALLCQRALPALLEGRPQQPCLQLQVLLSAQRARHVKSEYQMRNCLSKKESMTKRQDDEARRALARINGAGAPATMGEAAAAAGSTPPGEAGGNSAEASSSSGGEGGAASTQLAPAAAADKKPADKGEPKSWAPAWLSKLMDYPRKRPQPPPQQPRGSTSPLQQDAPALSPPASGGATKEDDGWSDLDRMRNMSLDGYMQALRSETAAEDDSEERPPRPRTPRRKAALRPHQPTLDDARAQHGRYMEQVDLILLMEPHQKDRVSADPQGCLRDPEFIREVSRAWQRPQAAVADLLRCYIRRREFVDLLAEHRDAGHQLPPSSDSAAAYDLVMQLRDNKAAEEQRLVLEARDPASCKLRAWQAVVGPYRVCARTNLPYHKCCGALGRKGASAAGATAAQ